MVDVKRRTRARISIWLLNTVKLSTTCSYMLLAYMYLCLAV